MLLITDLPRGINKNEYAIYLPLHVKDTVCQNMKLLMHYLMFNYLVNVF